METLSDAEGMLMDIARTCHLLPGGNMENILHVPVSGLPSRYRNVLHLGSTISKALAKGFQKPIEYIHPSGSRPGRFFCPDQTSWNIGIVTTSTDLINLLGLPIVYAATEQISASNWLTYRGVHILGFNSQSAAASDAAAGDTSLPPKVPRPGELKKFNIQSAAADGKSLPPKAPKLGELKNAGGVHTYTVPTKREEEEDASLRSRFLPPSSVYIMSDVCDEQEVCGELLKLLKCIPIRGSDGDADDDDDRPMSIEYDKPTYARYSGPETLHRITIVLEAVGKKRHTILSKECTALVQLHFRHRQYSVYNTHREWWWC